MQKKKDKVKDSLLKYELIIKLSLSFFFVTIFCLVFFLGGGLIYFKDVVYVDAFKDYDFQVHIIDVGQGDSILIKFPNDKTMLIDSGDISSSNVLVSYIDQYLRSEKLNKIDYMLLTHPDADHIGGAYDVLNNFDVESIFRPKIYSISESQDSLNMFDYSISDSEIYDNVIKKAYSENCKLIFSEKGILLNEGGCKIEFLSPELDVYSSSNNYSAVIMITYQDKKFLFTGDAEIEIEQQLIKDYGNELKADVLKLGHHGSKTSSSKEFLEMVNPKYAIICSGENNSGLPNVEVLNRLNSLDIERLSTQEKHNFVMSVSNNDVIVAFQAEPICDMALIITILIVLLLLVWGFSFKWFYS